MPRATVIKTRKKTQRARGRVARYSQRHQEARTPADQHRNAAQWLANAVRSSNTPDRHARRLATAYDPDVRHLLASADLGEKQAQLYRDQLDTPREPRPQLSQTLRLLHAVAGHLDDPDDTHTHYTQQLSDEARNIDAPHLRERG